MTRHNVLQGLYAITDPGLIPADRLLATVEQAIAGGARVLQYRNKTASFAEQVSQAAALRSICQQYGAVFLVNDDPDLCQAVSADGVHVGQQDAAVAEARRRLGQGAIIGATCHNRDDLVRSAMAQGADYIAVGRLHPSFSKPEAPQATLADLTRIRGLTDLPIVAIGGLTVDNAGAAITAGADMIAVIHGLFSAPPANESAGTSTRHSVEQRPTVRRPVLIFWNSRTV